MDGVKILAPGNLPLPPVRFAVLLSRLFVSLLAAFGEGSRQLWRAQFVRLSWDPSSAKPFHGQRPCQTLISVRTRASGCGVGLLPSTTCDLRQLRPFV